MSLLGKSPSPSSADEFLVFRCEYVGQRNHQALFVETHELGQLSGHKFHVIGSILNGMQYQDEPAIQPEMSAEFVTKHYLGTVSEADYARFNGACAAIPVPGKQMDLRGRVLDTSKPVRRCGEWTRDAIEKLRADGILK